MKRPNIVIKPKPKRWKFKRDVLVDTWRFRFSVRRQRAIDIAVHFAGDALIWRYWDIYVGVWFGPFVFMAWRWVEEEPDGDVLMEAHQRAIERGH